MRRIPLLVASLLAFTLAGAARAQPPVWVIHDQDSTITLFGSVHILPQGKDWRPAALKTALAKADDIWFELPLDAASRAGDAQRLVQRGMLPPGQTLTSMLSPTDKARLQRVATTFGQPLGYFDQMAPWMADVVLSSAFAAAHGGENNLGVDEVLNREMPQTVRRRAFETADQQIETLAGASRADQIADLSDTLRSIEEEPQQYEAIVDLWMKSDLTGLVHEAIDPLKAAAPGLYNRLIRDRNAAWVPQILDRLKGSGDTVIVVGVGHLVGPDSVPAMLRARGLKVDGPDLAEPR